MLRLKYRICRALLQQDGTRSIIKAVLNLPRTFCFGSVSRYCVTSSNTLYNGGTRKGGHWAFFCVTRTVVKMDKPTHQQVFLYYANLVGYLRVSLLFFAFYWSRTSWTWFTASYACSFLLDMADGAVSVNLEFTF